MLVGKTEFRVIYDLTSALDDIFVIVIVIAILDRSDHLINASSFATS